MTSVLAGEPCEQHEMRRALLEGGWLLLEDSGFVPRIIYNIKVVLFNLYRFQRQLKQKLIGVRG